MSVDVIFDNLGNSTSSLYLVSNCLKIATTQRRIFITYTLLVYVQSFRVIADIIITNTLQYTI